MTHNVERLRKVREHVLGENWRQNRWGVKNVECGTSFCAAGWACHDAGDKFLWTPARKFGLSVGDTEEAWRVQVDGADIDVFERGRDLLGLTEEEAEELFDSSNSRERMIQLIDQYIVEA